MKTYKLIATTILTLVLMQAATAYDLAIGNNHFDIVFENASAPSSLKDFIVADLTNMFSFADSLVNVFPSSSAPGVYRLHGKDPFMYPDSAKTGITLVTSTTNQYIEIASELYTAYDNASLLVNSYPVAISQLSAFINSLNSLSHTNMVVESLVGLLAIPPEVPTPMTSQFLADITSFCQMMEEYRYYYPSILSIRYKNEILSAIVVMQNRENQNEFDVVEINYIGGVWKLVFPL